MRPGGDGPGPPQHALRHPSFGRVTGRGLPQMAGSAIAREKEWETHNCGRSYIKVPVGAGKFSTMPLASNVWLRRNQLKGTT